MNYSNPLCGALITWLGVYPNRNGGTVKSAVQGVDLLGSPSPGADGIHAGKQRGEARLV